MCKRAVWKLFLFVWALCLVGCGREEEEPEILTSVGTAATEADQLYINECIPLLFDDPAAEGQKRSCLYDTYGSTLYILWICGGEEEPAETLSLYAFDGETGETVQLPFALRIPDRENYSIKSMDVREGEQLSFRVRDGRDDILVITDLEGTVLSLQEPFPDPDEYPWNADELHRFAYRAYDNGDHSVILSRCMEQENLTRLFLYDPDTSEEKPLTVLDGELVRSLCSDGADALFYTTVETLSRWNRTDNTHTGLLNLHENGISASPSSNNLFMNSRGELMICELEGELPYVFVLSGEKRQAEDEIRISILSRTGAGALDRPVQMFSRSYPESAFVLESYSGQAEREALHDRVFVEMAAGRGPDLLWVSREDMYILRQKGLLMDLSGLIPEDTKQQLLPCVIRSGTIDGQLTGMKLYSSYQTLFVSDALWEKDSWTVSDMLELIQSREDWDSTFSYCYWDSPLFYTPYELLSEVMLTDLEHSEFLDLDEKTCNFASAEFIRLLEACKKYGQTEQPQQDMNEWYEQLREGNSIAHMGDLADGLASYSTDRNVYEGSAHIVGYPARDGSKNYISSNNPYLVVNAKSGHIQEIKELLAYLLSYECQFEESHSSVRKDVITDSVVYSESDAAARLKVSASKDVYMQLDTKPDGSSWLEEYLAFLDTCEPKPDWNYTQIGKILSEETAPYFAGDKSAEEAARIIQSRIKLYLEESS